MASQSQRIIKQDMKILIEPSVPSDIIPKVKKISPSPTHSLTHHDIAKATLGLVILSSTSLAKKRELLTTTFRMKPYSEVMYNFHSKHEQILVLEQIFASR
jgi:hypothetical protein